jgi:hypothetical protein
MLVPMHSHPLKTATHLKLPAGQTCSVPVQYPSPALGVTLGLPWRHCRLQTEMVKGLASGEHWLDAVESVLMHLYWPASQPDGAGQGLMSMAAGVSHCSEHTLIRKGPDWHIPNAMEIPPVHLNQPGLGQDWAVLQMPGVVKGEEMRGAI